MRLSDQEIERKACDEACSNTLSGAELIGEGLLRFARAVEVATAERIADEIAERAARELTLGRQHAVEHCWRAIRAAYKEPTNG